MRPLLFVTFMLSASAATGDITAVRIVKDTCAAGISCNGWVAEVDISGLSAGGTYSFGLGAQNNPSTAKMALTVTSLGYDPTGSATTITRTVYGVFPLRKPYPNDATHDESSAGGTLTVRVVLGGLMNGDLYASDTATATIATGFYTQGTASNAVTNLAVTNNSTRSYPPSIFRWRLPVQYTQITGNFALEAFVANRFANNGKPMAAVIFTVTDQHAHSVSYTAASLSKSSYASDRNVVQIYAATVNVSTLTQGDILTCSGIGYPWVGNSGSVVNSNSGITQPDARLSDLLLLNDKSGSYGGAFAVVDAASGHTSTASTWVVSTQAGAESAYASSHAHSYDTIGRAIDAIKAFNNTNYSRNEPGGGVVLVTGTTNVCVGFDPGANRGAQNAYVTVTHLSSATRAQAGCNAPSGQARTSKIRYYDLTLTDGGTSLAFQGGDPTLDVLWLDHNTMNLTSATPFLSWKLAYVTGNDVTQAGDLGFSLGGSVNAFPFSLIIGNAGPSSSNGPGIGADLYAFLGNSNITPKFIPTGNAAGIPISDNSVAAFNTSCGLSVEWLASDAATSLTTGMGVVQNIIEEISGGPAIEMFAGQGLSQTVTENNVLFWHNVVIGERMNWAYNDLSSGGPVQKLDFSLRGNYIDDFNVKTDTASIVQNTAATGNWTEFFAGGDVGNQKRTSVSQIGDFLGLFGITGGAVAFTNCASLNYQSSGCSGAANGNYLPTVSSPLLNLIPAGAAVLAWDITGVARRNDGTGAAGAFEFPIFSGSATSGPRSTAGPRSSR